MPESNPTQSSPVPPDRNGFSPSDQLPVSPPDRSAAPVPGKIGHYMIRRRIATGGMGAVYEATQENPRRTVAVKVMKHGISSKTALRRFEYEAQLLGRLEHRGIAQVFEAGTYDEGEGPVPFFAMEYIANARRIIDYMEEKRLENRERIELMVQVCDAVQHGHQKGIIHRDLKPANILVDSHGQVKVIDFGVARATDADVFLTHCQTDAGQLVGTLQYMSPEQCDSDPRDLDARSDVYALGIVLYEVLCRRLPYDLSGMSVSVATKVIRNFQPPRPSAVVTILRGDIETILLRALEKERDRRYRTAADLADDLRRYLNQEPILARPPSLRYQLRLFARRNRWAFAASSAVAASLLLGTVVSTALYWRAESARADAARQRDAALNARAESQAVVQFLNDTIASVDALHSHGPDVTVVEMLDDAAAKIEGAFDQRPEVEAALRRTIGNSYRSLERFALAEAQLRAALELRKRAFGPESAEVAECERDLAATLQGKNRIGEAEALFRRALATQRKLLDKDDLALAETLNELGVCLLNARRPDSAEPSLREALGIRRRVLGSEHRLVSVSLDNLGAVLQERGRFTDATLVYRESLAILGKIVAPRHISVAYTMNLLGWCQWRSGDLAGAERSFADALDITEPLRDSRRGLRASILSGLGGVLHEQSRLVEAEKAQRGALHEMLELSGETDPGPAPLRIALAKCLLDQGKPADAEEQARKALEVLRRSAPPAPAELGEAVLTLGISLVGQREYVQAEPLLREALDLQRASNRAESAKVALGLDGLGVSLASTDRADQAEPLLREAVEKFTSAYGAKDWRTAYSRGNLGFALLGLGRLDDAEKELVEAYGLLCSAKVPRDRYRSTVAETLAQLYDLRAAADPTQGFSQRSSEWRAKAASPE